MIIREILSLNYSIRLYATLTIFSFYMLITNQVGAAEEAKNETTAIIPRNYS